MSLGFAHRGFSGKYPENTMLAFEKALEAGCDGIELDVQLSKDGVVMILHDESLKRTTGAGGYIWQYTKNELEKFEIPTLREYFELVKQEAIITNIELKTGINPYYKIIAEDLLFEAAAYNLKINAWTVNNRADIERLSKLGIYGIIGNYPDVMRKVLHG